VGDVGDLLELLHGAAGRWTTVSCTIAEWRHVARANAAFERSIEESSDRGHSVARMTFVSGESRGPQPETHEHRSRVWIAKPGRSRHETDDWIQVRRGPLWWSWSRHRGFMSNEREPEVGSGDPIERHGPHFDPSPLIAHLDFESIEPGGDAIEVRARPRVTLHGVAPLPVGADEHLLSVDPVRGVVLRVESRYAGEPFWASELSDAVWDETIDDALFTIEVPPGEELLSPRDLDAIDVSLEEAATAASFALFAVPELPEGIWRTTAHHRRARGETPESVTIVYHRADGRGVIHLLEQEATDGPRPWSRQVGAAEVVRVLDGTEVRLSSQDYDEVALRALADGLVQA